MGIFSLLHETAQSSILGTYPCFIGRSVITKGGLFLLYYCLFSIATAELITTPTQTPNKKYTEYIINYFQETSGNSLAGKSGRSSKPVGPAGAFPNTKSV